VQEHTDLQTFALTSYDLKTLVAYAREGKASKAVVEAIQKAAAMQAAITETQRRIGLLDQERQSIEQDQARIRQNMNSIARDTELYRRYTTKFNDQETRLEAIQEQRAKEQATLTGQQQELETYIRGLSVE
jgi:peptidoglycan hydrolase CwlO-like protein